MTAEQTWSEETGARGVPWKQWGPYLSKHFYSDSTPTHHTGLSLTGGRNPSFRAAADAVGQPEQSVSVHLGAHVRGKEWKTKHESCVAGSRDAPSP